MSFDSNESVYALPRHNDSACELHRLLGALRLTPEIRDAVASLLRPSMLRQARETGGIEQRDTPMCLRDFCDIVRADLLSRPEFVRDINELIEKSARALVNKEPSDFSPEMRYSITVRTADKIATNIRELARMRTDDLFPPAGPSVGGL